MRTSSGAYGTYLHWVAIPLFVVGSAVAFGLGYQPAVGTVVFLAAWFEIVILFSLSLIVPIGPAARSRALFEPIIGLGVAFLLIAVIDWVPFFLPAIILCFCAYMILELLVRGVV